ncbi:hypothetical protein DBR40_18225 [Pedobacter sp. KBW01]|uniref:ester cyclase n=1 Tax=Pedobacter sp. KBW01 TaxID=2153364 RepID=UPI000F5A07E0|nr:ester cyclase [Pedobacter sp. KBW01]RQO68923.1 hypothetical protein DBR40_18225 [Pedobacter sp. KBW01]
MKTLENSHLKPTKGKTWKKVTIAALAITGLLVASCSQEKKRSDGTEQAQNKQQAKKWYKAFNTKDSTLLQSLLDEQWQDFPADPNHPVGKKEVGGLLNHLTTVFTDFKCEIKDILQDGNKVIVRSVLSGKQQANFRGFASKGQTMSIQAVDIHEFQNGKIIRTWHTEDWLSGLGQLGHIPD